MADNCRKILQRQKRAATISKKKIGKGDNNSYNISSISLSCVLSASGSAPVNDSRVQVRELARLNYNSAVIANRTSQSVGRNFNSLTPFGSTTANSNRRRQQPLQFLTDHRFVSIAGNFVSHFSTASQQQIIGELENKKPADSSCSDKSDKSMSKVEFKRLPTNVVPRHYNLELRPQLEAFTFDGSVSVNIQVTLLLKTPTCN